MSTVVPINYGTIKSFFNSPIGFQKNPYFGRWSKMQGNPNTLQPFVYVIDTLAQQVYKRHYETTDGLCARTDLFHDMSGNILTSEEVLQRLPSDALFVDADTVNGNFLLVCDKDSTIDKIHISAYRLLALGKCNALRCVEVCDRQIHWVWIRCTPTWRLNDEIILRAASWIELNPGFVFHLWTNLRDREELADFLMDLRDDLHARYFDSGCIQVHFTDEFRGVILDWVSANVSQETHDVFVRLWDSTEKQDIVMKTDYTRNILLAVFGGIYADFNDLVCLSPIEPLIETHAGNYFGVTDNFADSHASNYLLYAGVGNETWRQIVVGCTETLPIVHGVIYDADSLNLSRSVLTDILDGKDVCWEDVQRSLDACPLKSPAIHVDNFILTLCMAVGVAIGEDSESGIQMKKFITSSLRPHRNQVFHKNAIAFLQSLREQIAPLLCAENRTFAPAWRFARTDMYLNTIMHRSNLPIFCRQQEIPIYLVPFSYLLKYSCLLSWIGHLGDGSSYGRPPARRAMISEFQVECDVNCMVE